MLKIVSRLDPSVLSVAFIDQAKVYDPISSEAWRAANLSEESGDVPEEVSLEDESNRLTGNFWAQLDTTNAISETCFWIDVNIDGIQLFKNSQRPQVILQTMYFERRCFLLRHDLIVTFRRKRQVMS
jgi:hypothetical protein